MTDELVGFEVAKLAKEKGFDERTILWYGLSNEIINLFGCTTYNSNKGNRSDFQYTAPTQSLLQRWLREKHGIHIGINLIDETREYYWEYYLTTSNDRFYYDDECLDWAKTHENELKFDTFEQALEEGLLIGLKLIK